MAPRKRQRKEAAWKDIASQACALRDLSLAEASRDDTGEDVDLTATLTAEEIVRLTTSDPASYPSRRIVDAFLHSAVRAHQQTNCITELLPIRARERADRIDALFRESGGAGILHGVPVSVKSHIGIQGRRTPSSYTALWDIVSPRDALVVQILEQAGAIVHARTTEPQGMMLLECVSNLYGTTVNPYNKELSSGGSSGGEAALIASSGSPLGVGSDVGGSIRVPAAACGIYGLKPTGFRVPTTGWSSTPPGADPITTVLGPMSKSIEGVEMFMRAVLAAEPWVQEPALIPFPWRDIDLRPTTSKPLRIGILWHDSIVLPHPPVTRALQSLRDKMMQIPEVQVFDFAPYKHDEGWAILSSLYFTDGGKAEKDLMGQTEEPILPLTEWIMSLPGVKNLTREELEYWLEEREEYRLEYAEAWNKTGKWNNASSRWVDVMDALICPVGPGTTTKHGTAKFWTYSAIWNLLDYPAMAFPVGKVDKTIDISSNRTEYMTDMDEENWQLYDPATFDNMPIGLQIVGRRFDDEKIVGIVKYLQEHSS